MKLNRLIKNYEWLSVKQILCLNSQRAIDCIDKYEIVFNKLKLLNPIESSIILMIDREYEENKEVNYGAVYGFDNSISQTELTPYLALTWISWSEWLGLSISQDTQDEWTELEIICNCLIEMTLDGFSESEVQVVKHQIVSVSDEIKGKYFKNRLDN